MSMNDNMSAPGADCSTFADLLPLLESSALTVDEASRTRDHASACAWCRRQLAAYGTVDVALRQYLEGLDVQGPFRDLEAITRLAEGADERAETIPQPIRHHRRAVARAFSGAASIAAVLLIAVLAQYVFTSHHRLPTRGTQVVPTATPTLSQLTVYQSASRGAGVNQTSVVSSYRASDGAPLATVKTVTASAISQGIVYGIKPATGGQSTTLVAQRASDGSLVWSVPIDGVETPTIVVVNGVLYFSTSSESEVATGMIGDATIHAVYAYRASDGARLWRHDLPKQWISPPAVSNGVVYDAGEHDVWALRASDGSVLWSVSLPTNGLDWISQWLTATPNMLYMHVALTSPDGRKDHFAAHVLALGAADGKQMWDAPLGNDATAALGPYAPVVADGVVYDRVSSADFMAGTPEQLHLIALRASDGSRLWEYTVARPQEYQMGIPDMKEPAVVGGAVYTAEDGGWISALRASDGSRLWRTRVDYSTPTLEAYPYSVSSPVFANGYDVLFVNCDDAVEAVRARDGVVLWTRVLFATEDVAPVVGLG